jgi:phosphoribosylglycinamide formyltransferase-1
VTKRVGIFVSGGGSNLRALVDDMVGDHTARPVVVVSNNAQSGGISWANNKGIPTVVVDHRPFGDDRLSFENAVSAAIHPYFPDILCLAGFMRVFTADFISSWPNKILNIHPSLLPRYKGLNTHERVLKAGDKEHGCSVHLVTSLLDDGPILGQAHVPVIQGDTASELSNRVLAKEHILYPAVLRRFTAGDTRFVRL